MGALRTDEKAFVLLEPFGVLLSRSILASHEIVEGGASVLHHVPDERLVAFDGAFGDEQLPIMIVDCV